MTKRSKTLAPTTERGKTESAPIVDCATSDPPKKNLFFLLGGIIAFSGWLAFLIWLALVS